MTDIKDNLAHIHSAIQKAAAFAGRNPQDTNLIAVSKNQSNEKIESALTAGQRLFGENRVQEAQNHWLDKRTLYPDLRLHLIGPLQSNKVKDAVALFDVIHSVDREKLAHKLGEEMRVQGRALPCFIQVNTGEEPQKAGIPPKDLPAFLSYCMHDCGLQIIGLMCIPPVEDTASLHFAFLNKLASENGLNDLSMGMSDDYETAITLGATYIRVGSALFGHRI